LPGLLGVEFGPDVAAQYHLRPVAAAAFEGDAVHGRGHPVAQRSDGDDLAARLAFDPAKGPVGWT
jgi:hypothetical protein